MSIMKEFKDKERNNTKSKLFLYFRGLKSVLFGIQMKHGRSGISFKKPPRGASFFSAACLIFAFTFSYAAGNTPSQAEDNSRYVLLTMGETSNITSVSLRKIPALVLDTWAGIIWRCSNIQEENPDWIKTDLAKNGNNVASYSRYTAKISGVVGSQSRISSIVLDTEGGKAWTCSDISADEAKWVMKDLVEDIKQGGYYTPQGTEGASNSR